MMVMMSSSAPAVITFIAVTVLRSIVSSPATRPSAGQTATAAALAVLPVPHVFALPVLVFTFLQLVFFMFGFELVTGVCSYQGGSGSDETIAMTQLMAGP